MLDEYGINIDNITRDTVRDYLNDFDIYNNISSLGSFGKVVFRVSDRNILTPSSVSATIGARIKRHTRIADVDISEFETRNLKQISLPIKLVSELCNIKDTIKELTKICENGENYPLILAKEQIGENNFCLTNFTYNYSQTDGIGNPLVAELNLTLEEYIERLTLIKEKNTSPEANTILKEKIIYNANKILMQQLREVRLW